jgi:hypothetical protein
MKWSLHLLAPLAVLLVLTATRGYAQQPMTPSAPSVLSSPMPAAATPANGPSPGAEMYPGYEAYGGYPMYEDGSAGFDAYGCEECDQRWFGRHRPIFTGYWGGFEGLLWWNKGRYMPALATTSNAADRGVLGQPSTSVLFGQDHIGSDLQSGGRLTLGAWLDPIATTGIGLRFTAIEGDRTRFDSSSDGSTVLARPYFNATLPGEDASLLASPGQRSGSLAIRTENDFLTTDVFGRMNVWGTHNSRVDVIAGYQFARLDDSLQLRTASTNIDPLSIAFGSRTDVLDSFSTENEFHGAEFGLMGERRNGRAKISWLAKIAAGNMRQQSTIDGNTAVNAGPPATGGLLTQGTNIGVYERNRFAFIPEANINLHYQLTQRIDLSMGYSIIYLNSVALSGDQIDRRVNLSQQTGPLVGPANPSPVFNVTDFWLQGMNFGVNFSF